MRYKNKKPLMIPIDPSHPGRCYACDSAAIGVRDRRPEGGEVEPACKRHRDPWIKAYHGCIYCGDPVRRGSLYVDSGQYAHHRCHRDAVRDRSRK